MDGGRRRTMTKLRTVWAQAFIVGGLAAVVLTAAWARRDNSQGSPGGTTTGTPGIDPKADAFLRRSCDYLKNLKSFSVNVDHETEVVTKSGQKLQLLADSTVYVQRPNRMRSDRGGELADVSFFYDGSNITVFSRKANLFATAAAPPTLDAAIDFAREKLEIEAPGADLLYADPYRVLTEDVVSGIYVGRTEIDNVPVHHLAFRGRET